MVKTLLILLAFGCSAVLPDPCSVEMLTAQTASVVAECKMRREVECHGYDVLEECPLIQECDARIERVGAGCDD